jgi:chromosome segregation ATPase
MALPAWYEIDRLKAQLESAKNLFAQFYQVLGAHDANENALDAALAASDGNFDFELCPYVAEVDVDGLQDDNEQLRIKLSGAEAACRLLHEDKQVLSKELAKANERVKELEEELATKELLHVGFTNGSQIKYAKVEEGSFYPNTDGNCYIPLYMLKSHEHRIETTSVEQLRKEQEQ